VDRAVVGGLSLGGYVAFAMLRQRPERVSGLILADTRCTADAPEGRDARLRMLDVLAARGPHGIFLSMAPGVMGATTQQARPLVVERVRQLILSQSRPAIEGALRAMLDRPDSTDLLPTIEVPTLILVGDQDIMTPVADAERMHAGIRGSELVVLSGSGHLSNMETPYAFNAAVSAFLSGLPGA
jgi:pimeloyl-ACP methyl ester carboxylesterase